MWETGVWSLGWEDPLEKGKATHCSILTWRIPKLNRLSQQGHSIKEISLQIKMLYENTFILLNYWKTVNIWNHLCFSFFILKCLNISSDSHSLWGFHSLVLALLLTSCLILFILPKLNFAVKWGYEHVNHLVDKKIKQANVCRVFTWHSSSTDSKAVPVENITFRDKESLELLISIHLPGGRHPLHRGSNKGHAAIQPPLDTSTSAESLPLQTTNFTVSRLDSRKIFLSSKNHHHPTTLHNPQYLTMVLLSVTTRDKEGLFLFSSTTWRLWLQS